MLCYASDTKTFTITVSTTYNRHRWNKEAIYLSAIGYLQVRAYVSNAQIPLKDVAVAITDTGGSAIALRLTNRSGELNQPIEIEVPDLSASQTPDTGTIPYTTVNLYARYTGFEEIFVENVQVFADTVTEQNLELIPLSEFPESFNLSERFDTLTQNL